MDPGVSFIVTKLKRELVARGGSGYHAVQRKFRIMDDDGSKSLSWIEYKKAMAEMNFANLIDMELRKVFEHFDKDRSGSISFEEFLTGIRDPLTARRLDLVLQAFNLLDTDGSGIVDAEEVAGKFDASQHPDVLAGRATPNAVLRQFLETFGGTEGKVTRDEFVNYYHNLSASIDSEDYFELMIRNAWHISGGEGAAANSANRRVLVTRADGSQYVEEIKNDLGLKAGDKAGMLARLKAQGADAASISLFDGGDDNNSSTAGKKALVKPQAKAPNAPIATPRSAQSLPPPPPTASESFASASGYGSAGAPPLSPSDGKRSTPSTRGKKALTPGIQMIVSKLKESLKQHGAHGFHGLQRKFRIMDDDGSKALKLAEFKKGMQELNMGIADADLRQLFSHFDADNSGSISFDEFILALRDPLTARRLALVQTAFNVLDTDGSGVIEFSEISSKFDASQHPDVIANKKTSAQVLREWMTVFQEGCSSGGGGGMVTIDDFVNYYTNLGASIDSEDYFELMIRNAWHISGGEGAAANSANRRVLVTRADGSQYVEEIKNDLGLKAGDKAGMLARLKAQGADAASISLFDGGDDNSKSAFISPTATATATKKPAPSSTLEHVKAHDSSLSVVGSALLPHSLASPSPSKKTPAVSSSLAALGLSDDKPASPARTPSSVAQLLSSLKESLATRGARGIVGLSRKFKIIDDDNNGILSVPEFKKAMQECALLLTDEELRALFSHFDADASGGIDFEEFMQGLRGPLSKRRLDLIYQAFAILDTNGSGDVTPDEIMSKYDATRHPDVIRGFKTAQEVLREFLDTFDVGGVKDGVVTRAEFVNYYHNLSASIDSEDYFELMIRNAWHISGGEGAAANSANRRVLVTRADGSQYVEEIKNDLGLKAGDKAGMLARLKAQGADAASISLFDGGDDNNKKPGAKPLGQVATASSSNPPYLQLGSAVQKPGRRGRTNGNSSSIQF